MSENVNLQIAGLSELQLTELKSDLTQSGEHEDSITVIEPPSLKGNRHGEPGLATVLLEVTPVVLSVISLWLAKQRGRRTESFKYSKTDGKGQSKTIEFKRSAYEEGAASASSIEAFLKGKLNAG